MFRVLDETYWFEFLRFFAGEIILEVFGVSLTALGELFKIGFESAINLGLSFSVLLENCIFYETLCSYCISSSLRSLSKFFILVE